MRLPGSCHCGEIRFEVEVPEAVEVERCNCLDELPTQIHVLEFDGRNWEQNAHKLAHKSRA